MTLLQEVAMPTTTISPEQVNSEYALAAVLICSILPFALIFAKMIFDNRKSSNMKEYIESHHREHEQQQKNFDTFLNRMGEQVESTNKAVMQLTINSEKMQVQIDHIKERIEKCPGNKEVER